MADKNAELIAGVLAELKAKAGRPSLPLRLDDDVCAFVESNPMAVRCRNGRFQAFQSGTVNVVSSRRSPVMLLSSAIIGC